MKTMRAEKDTALSRNQAAMERLRTTVEGYSRTLLLQMILVVGLGFAVMGVIVSLMVA